MESYILICLVFVIILVTLIGFFITKKEGFGKFTLSSLLLIMVISISSLLYIDNKIDEKIIVNIFFAIIGFAGGLFTSSNVDSKDNHG